MAFAESAFFFAAMLLSPNDLVQYQQFSETNPAIFDLES